MSEESDGWRYEAIDSVGYFTIDRPERLNALTPEVLEGIVGVVRAAYETGMVAVVFRGSGGRAFSSGVDLRYFLDGGLMADAGKSLAFTERIRDTLREVERCPVPTIAAVHGYALAGGLELALACDFILCTDDAQLGDQHANYHLMPGAGGTQRLPRRIGSQRALELLLTGRSVSGREAVAIGLALRSSPADDFDALVEDLLAGLRGKSRAAMVHVKRAVWRGADMTLADALDFERLTTQEFFSRYPDATEGLRAFIRR